MLLSYFYLMQSLYYKEHWFLNMKRLHGESLNIEMFILLSAAIFSFCRWRIWGPERLNNLTEFTQLDISSSGIRIYNRILTSFFLTLRVMKPLDISAEEINGIMSYKSMSMQMVNIRLNCVHRIWNLSPRDP
jgi:hypothetical protein